MRVDIKTNGPVKDKDIRALHLIKEAMKISTPRMRIANLEFAAREQIDRIKLESRIFS